jgi:hypothetical protein
MVDVTIDDLTESERLLWEASPQGTWVDLRAGKIAGHDPGDLAGWVPVRTLPSRLLLPGRRP